jgi:hypothetical protein
MRHGILVCLILISIRDGWAEPPEPLHFESPLWRGQYDEPLVTDRPDFTEASSTVGRGVVQTEMGYTYFYDDDDARAERTRTHSTPEILVRAGVTDGVELRIFWDYLWETVQSPEGQTPSDGAIDMFLGTKLQLFEGERYWPEQALVVAVGVPTGANDFTANEATYALNYLYGWDWGEWSIGGSTGLTSLVEEGDHFRVYSQSIALGIPLAEKVGMYVEYFGLFQDSAETNFPENYFDGGFTYLSTNNIQWDIRAGAGLNANAADFFTGAGLSLRF